MDLIYCPNPLQGQKTLQLAEEYGCCRVDQLPDEPYLHLQDGELSFRFGERLKTKLKLDFIDDYKKLSQQKISVKKDLLTRATGLDKNPGCHILDGTMGLARDSFHLLFFGAKVTAIERDTVASLLVHEAMNRFRRQTDFTSPFFQHHGHLADFLSSSAEPPDVLYLDPMFTETEKKSAPKKGLAFLRLRQQADTEMERVWELAQKKQIKRVVVKRSRKGQHLFTEPNFQITGKMIRFDIYQISLRGNLC